MLQFPLINRKCIKVIKSPACKPWGLLPRVLQMSADALTESFKDQNLSQGVNL